MLPRIRGVGLVAWLVILASLVDFTFAASVTVDDADPAITYSAGWNIGNTCSACFAQPPDHTQINDQTWHDSTRGANASAIGFQYTFTGDSLTVYGILVDIVETTFTFTTNVDLTLDIDGQTSRYTYTPVSRNSYQYQVPVFSEQGLSNSAHTMSVTLNPSSAFLFDYLVYTTPDTSTSSISTSASTSSLSTGISTSTSTPLSTSASSSSSSSSSSSLSAPGSLSLSIDTSVSTRVISPTADPFSSGSSTISIGSIVGIVAGVVGLLLIVIAILLFLLCRKRRRTRQNLGPQPLSAGMSDDHGSSEPFMQSTGLTSFPRVFSSSSHGASTSEVALNNMGTTTAFASSGNLNSSFNAPIGGANEAAGVASGAAITMNSKQRRMHEESGLLPSQRPQQRHPVPAWVSREGSAYSEGTAVGASVYSGTENLSSHTGPMSTDSGNTDYHDSTANTPLSRSTAPGVGGRIAPWNSGLYPHGIPAPVQLAAPVPVPLGLPLDSGGGSEARSMSAASGVTRPTTAPPPYIRSPPPSSTTDESGGRGLETVSEYDEKR